MKKMNEVIVFVVSRGKQMIFEGLLQDQANQAANDFRNRTGVLAEIKSYVYTPTDHT